MCGLAGFLTTARTDCIDEIVVRMAEKVVHRGPDDSGVWTDKGAGVGLAHRRLSIVDLSPAGHQPMVSISGRYVVVFNGEIYNHQALRRDLEGRDNSMAWRGHSDTETLLAGFDIWGIAETVTKAVGMFAFAVWDRFTRTLTLGRDRLGEKPLYYGWQGQDFLFGSELKALKAHPCFRGQIDRGVLALLMRHNYVPAPHTIYRDIFKLLPGTLLTVSSNQGHVEPRRYWDVRQVVADGLAQPVSDSPKDCVDMLEALLRDAVAKQMVADVPLGAFLSGGVDSSTIVALMQAQSSLPVRTFTIGFYEEGYNEAVHAKAVAKHLGTDHTEVYVSPQQALDVIPKLPTIYCEPFADSSAIPTFLVSQLARQQVTVSLSGDAGDEVFCGYDRYLLAGRLWRKLSLVPAGVRRVAARGLTAVSPDVLNRLVAPMRRLMPTALRFANPGDKLHKGAGVLASATIDALYQGLVSQWKDPAAVVIGGNEPRTLLSTNTPFPSGLSEIQRMMALDLLTYLPDDILVKVDRAAMGVSLESRAPFLDHRVVEFAWRLPMEYKLRGGETKWALRQVLYRHVPKSLIERPKMGFGVPIAKWLRGPLRDWAESLLDESRLRRDGFFRPAAIREKWVEHLSGHRNWQYHLWDVLMFQAWLECS